VRKTSPVEGLGGGGGERRCARTTPANGCEAALRAGLGACVRRPRRRRRMELSRRPAPPARRRDGPGRRPSAAPFFPFSRHSRVCLLLPPHVICCGPCLTTKGRVYCLSARSRTARDRLAQCSHVARMPDKEIDIADYRYVWTALGATLGQGAPTRAPVGTRERRASPVMRLGKAKREHGGHF
jgi:hypothetical protein